MSKMINEIDNNKSNEYYRGRKCNNNALMILRMTQSILKRLKRMTDFPKYRDNLTVS